MAAYQTLMRLEKEWTALVEARDTARLLEKMRYVYAQWELGKARYIGVSGLARLSKADLLAMVVADGFYEPAKTKTELVAQADDGYQRNKSEEREAFKTWIVQLERNEIPWKCVENMIHTLDMAW